MNSKSLLFAALFCLLLAAPTVAHAARPLSNAELRQEYASVRKIALKDPKVIWAFDRANKRLNERILEIDPALAPIVNAPVQQEKPAARMAKPTATVVRPRHKAPAASGAASSQEAAGTYTVKKGDTLTSIAGSEKMTVSAIEKANGLSGEAKLRVGQKLTLPAATAPASAAPSPPPTDAAKPKPGESAWDRLKSLYP